MTLKLKPGLNWLLVFVPITLLLEYVWPTRAAVVFMCSCLAIIPLAGVMGHATEGLAARAGAGVGGLLNATFGNAAEMIIAFMALSKGLHDVVKASLTGSIIGNILLVLGLSILVGGWKRERQRFNAMAASMGSTMLLLAAVSLVVPAAYAALAGGTDTAVKDLSAEISVVLLLTYVLNLFFSLKTHKHLYDMTGEEESHGQIPSLARSAWTLLVATVLVAWMSEILVGVVEETSHALGLTEVFVGVIVVAIIGNAAEHSTAVMMALKDKMDISIGIAVGSSVQIALFVAPVLMLASLFMERPMDLVFTMPEVLAVILSVWVVSQISQDGETNWLEGAQLLSVYAILGLVFYHIR
ncbi:MAG: calcium/proton exchanger [Candidatus Xenobium sp.]|jgi:Ca2+:H+ antiporter|nr:calcium/proton exchanger [Burkholderiales bacterium]